jgi:RNA 3'-terminal phosphate cyclase (ATP)
LSSLIEIDGSHGEGGGQILRTALSLSAVTGRGFTMTKVRARRARPGLRPQHLAAVHAMTLVTGARVGGAFEGSPDLRFEPGPIRPGEYRFEIATAGAATLVAQTVVVPLATADAPSRIEVTGGTHVPQSPSFDYFARHYAPMVGRLGLVLRSRLVKAGFYPPGGGEIQVEVDPWRRPGARLDLEQRGALAAVSGLSGAGKARGDAARRTADAAKSRLWEARRLESAWEVVEVPAVSPGAFLLVEAAFEQSRGAFGFLGEKGLRAEVLGDRAARVLLRFLDAEGAVDEHLADQLVVPLVVAGSGGRATTDRVTRHLVTVVDVVQIFGFRARAWGRVGGPGGVEVDPVDPSPSGP